MTVYSITIPGRPAPKARPRLGVRENTATSYRKEQAFKRMKTLKIGGDA
jgi:hypothetical protein